MVDMRKPAAYPAASHRGLCQKQPAEEFAFLRTWLAQRPSTAAYYRGDPTNRS
jgi:hypothetical protein